MIEDDANQSEISNYILWSSSEDPVLRAKGIRGLLEEINQAGSPNKEPDGPEAYDAIPNILLSTISDSDVDVLQQLYHDPNRLVKMVPYDNLIRALESVFSTRVSPELLSIHVSFLCRIVSSHDREIGRLGMILFPFLLVTKAAFRRSSATWKAINDCNAHDSLFLFGISTLLETTDWKAMKGDVSGMAQFNTRLVELLASTAT